MLFVLTGSLNSYTCRKGTHTTLNHFLWLWLPLGLDQCKHSLGGCRMGRSWCLYAPLNSLWKTATVTRLCHVNENLFPFLGPDRSTPPHRWGHILTKTTSVSSWTCSVCLDCTCRVLDTGLNKGKMLEDTNRSLKINIFHHLFTMSNSYKLFCGTQKEHLWKIFWPQWMKEVS